jgi:ABC-2 type transport system ATP-binding protein
MIHLEKLSKRFKGKPALIDLSLDIPAGEIFGLLGHNGAGKSTALGIMLGMIHPDAGEALIRGVSVQRDRRLALRGVGAIYETPGFYDYLTGWENLQAITCYSGPVPSREMEEVVELVGLKGRIHDRVGTFSHGMKQRLAIAQALLPTPDLLLLDEPMNGLDPEGVLDVRGLIKHLCHERGMTVVLSSHLLSEVEQLCDRVAILNEGRLVFEGRWAELSETKRRFRLDVDDWAGATKVFAALGVEIAESGIITLDPPREAGEVVTARVSAGIQVRSVEPIRPSLEQFYFGRIARS